MLYKELKLYCAKWYVADEIISFDNRNNLLKLMFITCILIYRELCLLYLYKFLIHSI